MPTSYKTFLIELYQEYLEEASFLYEQRLSLYQDPEITWLDIDDWEERFEPHIDGLVVGEDLALEVCQTQVAEGDFGELHAAVRVFCRHARKDMVLKVLDELDLEFSERIRAVGDAFKHELPVGWQDEIIKKLAEGGPGFIPILANLIGFRRIDAGKELLTLLQRKPSICLPEAIWALGRLRQPEARIPLLQCLMNGEESVRVAAILALLRLGEEQALKYCSQHMHTCHALVVPLGVGGNQDVTPKLLEWARNDDVVPDVLTALGLLGDVRAVDVLLTLLATEELAPSSALGLELITGGGLYEEVFVPEEVDEDELFPEELEKFQQEGEVPMHVDGRPFGTTVTQLSQNPDTWREWWTENKGRFDPYLRYRNGNLFSPACLVENLKAETSPNQIRRWAYEELVIRYEADFRFETDMLVREQQQVLVQYEEWIHINGNRFNDGEWYFADSSLGPRLKPAATHGT